MLNHVETLEIDKHNDSENLLNHKMELQFFNVSCRLNVCFLLILILKTVLVLNFLPKFVPVNSEEHSFVMLKTIKEVLDLMFFGLFLFHLSDIKLIFCSNISLIHIK